MRKRLIEYLFHESFAAWTFRGHLNSRFFLVKITLHCILISRFKQNCLNKIAWMKIEFSCCENFVLLNKPFWLISYFYFQKSSFWFIRKSRARGLQKNTTRNWTIALRNANLSPIAFHNERSVDNLWWQIKSNIF